MKKENLTLEQKLLNAVKEECEYAEKRGSSRLDVCDLFWYGWDKDLWVYRQEIVTAIQNRGYSVTVTTRDGVTEIHTRKMIKV